MSGYNNPNENNYFGNNYVNFDQFLMQHNIGGQAQYFTAPLGIDTFDQQNMSQRPYEAVPTFFDEPPTAPAINNQKNGQYFNNDLVLNSNLVPTANEFVPQYTFPPINTNLIATASEFIPKSSDCNNEQYSNTGYSSSSMNDGFATPASSSVADAPFENSVTTFQTSNDNNNKMWNDNVKVGDVDVKSQMRPDQLLAAISISDESKNVIATNSTTNSSSPANGMPSGNGGAIKKSRSTQNKESRRINHDTQNNSGRSDQRERLGGAHDNPHSKDSRRPEKNHENRRYGTGRTASQYDNTDRYNNKNEYFNDKYANDERSQTSSSSMAPAPVSTNSANSRWNNSSHHQNNYHYNNGEPENTSRHFNRSQKNKRNGDHHTNKKYDDFKANRNSKTLHSKIDSTNCSQREKLIREIDAGKLECLVCCEMIKPFQSTWSCPNCFHIIHLNCVIKWAASSKSDEGWRCCACQNINKAVPHEYFCFCGKMKDPQYNRSDVAHSCGDVCGRTDGCEHRCTQLCHPGPCPPCHATVTRTCGCGRSSKTMQCCQKDDLECDKECDKQLNCQIHRCAVKCHVGPCTECNKEIEHTCHCGRDIRQMPCTNENNQVLHFSCKEICNKLLNCQNHKCKEKCHPGVCAGCKLMPDEVTTCPCGKTPIANDQRVSCTDPIPLCGSVCKKQLTCGQPSSPHVCMAKCHTGLCPPCNKQTSVKCRCGHMDQKMKCTQLSTRADDARCKKRCTKKRSCGRHKCNQDCCIDIDHFCPMPCSFSLSCGKHKCDQQCHKGRCLPCYRSSFEELYCECGASCIYPPVPCGTKKPPCDKPCPRTHSCDHPVTHNCHSGDCPPCMAFTTKFCHGRHEQRKIIPCSQVDFSCGLKCQKPLKCGQHKCIKICHAGPCENDGDVCKQNCTKPRIMCTHQCNAPCHLERDCPDTPCRENVEVLCQCGLRKQSRTCHDFSSDYRKIATAKFASSMQDMQRGSTVELSDVLGPIKLTNNKTLECNEECKVQERNRKLAIGLQIRNPDLSSKLQPKYSEFVRSWAKKDPRLVTMIHDKLTELVKLAKESKQKSRSHSFPTMNREKRQLVHEMCAMFGVESVAYDAEPHRNIVASATRQTSWLPSMSIMEVVQRESGQRRIPVPSLNAWGNIRR